MPNWRHENVSQSLIRFNPLFLNRKHGWVWGGIGEIKKEDDGVRRIQLFGLRWSPTRIYRFLQKQKQPEEKKKIVQGRHRGGHDQLISPDESLIVSVNNSRYLGRAISGYFELLGAALFVDPRSTNQPYSSFSSTAGVCTSSMENGQWAHDVLVLANALVFRFSDTLILGQTD